LPTWGQISVISPFGYFTLLGATLVGSAGKVYAFEPDPANCRLLRDNCALNQLENVQVEELALSDQSGDGQLYLSEDNLGDHTIYNVRGARREQW
jgi:FkbM family methyltransferase